MCQVVLASPHSQSTGLQCRCQHNLNDLMAVVYSFCARLYGQHGAKRKTKRIIEDWDVMAMQLVEQLVISRQGPHRPAIDTACFSLRNLYNATNSIPYQKYIPTYPDILYPKMIQRQTSLWPLPDKASQQVLRRLDFVRRAVQ